MSSPTLAADSRPLIAFTPGDPAGIGPEILVAGWADLCANCRPVVVASAQTISRAISAKYPILPRIITEPSEALGIPNQMDILEGTKVDLTGLDWGKIDARGGAVARDCLHKAIDLALDRKVGAIVTGPLHKESLHLAGEKHPGHTEILAERCGVADHAMVLATSEVAVLHATLHMALRDIFTRLTPEHLVSQACLLSGLLERLGKGKPRIALPGLNPHAGDGGLFGDEESRILTKAVQMARARGIDLNGPISPDNVFIRAFDGEFDGILALYHDQGHIPLKLVGRRRCVNITAGLPIVRTSVAHGTAFDIAGKGIANPDSLLEATAWAVRLALKPV
jgi:4-hydroxythreonine-4-phosphate dehydrogenase